MEVAGGRGEDWGGECSNAVRGVGWEEEEWRGIVWKRPGRGGAEGGGGIWLVGR